jgi:hypothetical protein
MNPSAHNLSRPHSFTPSTSPQRSRREEDGGATAAPSPARAPTDGWTRRRRVAPRQALPVRTLQERRCASIVVDSAALAWRLLPAR